MFCYLCVTRSLSVIHVKIRTLGVSVGYTLYMYVLSVILQWRNHGTESICYYNMLTNTNIVNERGQINTSSLILNNSRTVSMLLNSISDSELRHVIHFNNTDSSLYQANIGIFYKYT